MMPMFAPANEVFTGKFVGFERMNNSKEALKGEDNSERIRQAELVFFEVNKKYYRIANMPFDEKEKYINKSVKIIGDINDRYGMIEAEEVKIKMRTRYVKVWSDEKLKKRNKWIKWEKEQREKYSGENMGG